RRVGHRFVSSRRLLRLKRQVNVLWMGNDARVRCVEFEIVARPGAHTRTSYFETPATIVARRRPCLEPFALVLAPHDVPLSSFPSDDRTIHCRPSEDPA